MTFPITGTIAPIRDGRLLMVGGNQGNTSDAVRTLDPTTWALRDFGHLLTLRTDPTATVLLDGRVLVVGGVSRRRIGTCPCLPAPS